MRFTHTLMFSLLAAAPAYSAYAQGPQPAPGSVTITGATFSGEACVDASAMLTPDQTMLAINYPNFFVQHTGQGNGAQTATEKCRINLKLNVPAGFQFAVVSVSGQGRAILDDKVTGSVNVKYGFNAKAQPTKSTKMKIKGPYANNYSNSFDMKINNASWGPCTGTERDLVVDTELSVKTIGATSGLMTYDSETMQMNDEFALVWRQCTGAPKTVVAVCRAEFKVGSNVKQVIGQGHATTSALAISAAQARAMQRCEKRTGNTGGACTIAANSCETLNI